MTDTWIDPPISKATCMYCSRPNNALFQVSDGFKKALRNDASIFWSMPSSKMPGLYLQRGSALKKSRCFAVMILGIKSSRPASLISNLDWQNATVFDAKDFPVRVFPIHVTGMLTKATQHLEKNFIRKPRHQTFQSERASIPNSSRSAVPACSC